MIYFHRYTNPHELYTWRKHRDQPVKVFPVTYLLGRQTVGEWMGRMEGFGLQLGRFSLLQEQYSELRAGNQKTLSNAHIIMRPNLLQGFENRLFYLSPLCLT